jgi:hypothetical protein
MSFLTNDPTTRPIFVHAHVPKSGGTSLNKLLYNWLQGRMQWMHFADPTRMFTQEEMDDYVAKNPELDCITSHHFRVFPPVIAGRPALYIAFLREPASFLISLARHWIRDRSELTPEFRAHLPPDFDQLDVLGLLRFLLDSAQRRTKPEHLLGSEMSLMFFEAMISELGFGRDTTRFSAQNEDWCRYLAKAIAIAQLKQFFFVGDFATLTEDIRDLARRLRHFGISADSAEIPWERRSTDQLFASAEEEDRIRALIPLAFPVDRDVYAYFHRLRQERARQT